MSEHNVELTEVGRAQGDVGNDEDLVCFAVSLATKQHCHLLPSASTTPPLLFVPFASMKSVYCAGLGEVETDQKISVHRRICDLPKSPQHPTREGREGWRDGTGGGGG